MLSFFLHHCVCVQSNYVDINPFARHAHERDLEAISRFPQVCLPERISSTKFPLGDFIHVNPACHPQFAPFTL